MYIIANKANECLQDTLLLIGITKRLTPHMIWQKNSNTRQFVFDIPPLI